jgi:carboxylesterase type B
VNPPLELSDLLEFALPWVPVVDGKELTHQPLRLLQTGDWNKVPTIVSSVANESVMFIYTAFDFALAPWELDVVEDALWDNLTIAQDAREVYGNPPANTTDARLFIGPMITDYLFYCPLRYATRGMAASVAGSGTSVYFNLFDYLPSWNSWAFTANSPYCVANVCHAEDVPVIFFSLYAAPASVNAPTPSADDEHLANLIQRQWGNFARTGNPSTAALPYPAYTATSSFVMNMSVPSALLPDFRADYCDFWDRMGYYRF